mmetsp:Transcript_24118/g.67132  ORF Transcript_24118/g.67132 Transcript_24118/m.67132 type:complete len:386 (-) Transcript_24118:348-1505(-)
MPRSSYDFLKELGRGSFGVVYQVQRRADETMHVCKQVTLKGMSEKMQAETNEEVVLLRRVSKGCEFIVQYVESFLEDGALHIVMEFCAGGDLGGYLQARARHDKRLDEQVVWKFLLQVGTGLQWLHSNRILHRDIKPLNVFLTAREDARIGDLGVARMLDKDSTFAKTLIGTPFYLSPEVCNQQAYNDRSDVWAYGCVIYETCALKRPFEGKNSATLLMKIMAGKYAPIPGEYSSKLHDFVASCLEREPRRRASMEELMSMPAVREWATELAMANAAPGDASIEPRRVQAWKRWRLISSKINRLHDEVVRDLDPPTREIWDNLYMLFRAKMTSAKLSDDDHSDIETHIFEKLPTENTDLIMKAAKILELEIEAEQYQEVLLPNAT